MLQHDNDNKRSKYRFLTIAMIIALTLGAGSVSAGGDSDSDSDSDSDNTSFCSATATLQIAACRNEVRDDYFIGKAICINISDENERDECFDDVAATRGEERRLCRDQRDARVALCDRRRRIDREGLTWASPHGEALSG